MSEYIPSAPTLDEIEKTNAERQANAQSLNHNQVEIVYRVPNYSSPPPYSPSSQCTNNLCYPLSSNTHPYPYSTVNNSYGYSNTNVNSSCSYPYSIVNNSCPYSNTNCSSTYNPLLHSPNIPNNCNIISNNMVRSKCAACYDCDTKKPSFLSYCHIL